MIAKKEIVVVVWKKEAGGEIPAAVLVRDPKTRIPAFHALEQMDEEQIAALINEAAAGEKVL